MASELISPPLKEAEDKDHEEFIKMVREKLGKMERPSECMLRPERFVPPFAMIFKLTCDKSKNHYERHAQLLMWAVEATLEMVKVLPKRLEDIPDVPLSEVPRWSCNEDILFACKKDLSKYDPKMHGEHHNKIMSIIMNKPEWKEKFEKYEDSKELRFRVWKYERVKENEDNIKKSRTNGHKDYKITTIEKPDEGIRIMTIKRHNKKAKIITIKVSEKGDEILTIE